MKHIVKGVIPAIFSGIVFGLVPIIINLIEGVPPFALAFLRPFIAALFILPFFLNSKELKKTKKDDLIVYAVAGFFLSIGIVSFTISVLIAPVATMTVIGSITPFLVIILSFLALKEKVTRRELLALVIAFAGILLVNPLEPANFQGAALMFVAALTFAAINVLLRQMGRKHHPTSVFWYLIFASVFILPLAIYSGFGDIQQMLLLIVLLGIANGLAYLTMNHALKHLSTDLVSSSRMVLTQATAIPLAAFILLQPVTTEVVISAAMLVAAFFVLKKEFFD